MVGDKSLTSNERVRNEMKEEKSAVANFLGAYKVAIQFRLKRRGQKAIPPYQKI